jgi:hypothetical protein
MKLYHGSQHKIKSFDDQRPIFFTSQVEDVKLAINNWDGDNVSGYVYQIEIEDYETETDFMTFHSGEVILNAVKDVVKMVSDDIDNNWFCIRNITKFNPIQVIY